MCQMLWNMYVDDDNIVDDKTVKDEGQRIIQEFFKLLGSPIVEKRTLWISEETDFLDIVPSWIQAAQGVVTI